VCRKLRPYAPILKYLAIARIDAIIIKPYQASKPLYQTSKL
jgi:hypothetical protein